MLPFKPEQGRVLYRAHRPSPSSGFRFDSSRSILITIILSVEYTSINTALALSDVSHLLQASFLQRLQAFRFPKLPEIGLSLTTGCNFAYILLSAICSISILTSYFVFPVDLGQPAVLELFAASK